MSRSDNKNRPSRDPRSPRQLLSLDESAEFLGVSNRTVRSYVARGILKAHRIRGSRLIRIDLVDLEALVVPVPTLEDL